MYWIEQRGVENVSESEGMSSLLSIVRFELMPIDYLYNIVQHNSVAKKFADFNDHYLRGISYHALSDALKERLPCQPVKREANTQSSIPYTWVIPRDDLDELVGTDESLKSDEFWYCGYRMVMVITDVIKSKNLLQNKAMFTATINLAIINLTEQSKVMIQWQPASQSFKSTHVEKKHTFIKYGRMSSVRVNYRIEIKPDTSDSGRLSAGLPQRSPESARCIFGTPRTPKPTPCLSIKVKMNLV